MEGACIVTGTGTYGDGLNGVEHTVRGLFYGDAGQLLAQIIGPLTNVVFIFVASWIFFKVLDAIMGIRVPYEVERTRHRRNRRAWLSGSPGA